MNDASDSGQTTGQSGQANRPNPPLPKLRPYQLPAAEQKARDEKEAAERLERIKELRRESEGKPKKSRKFLRFLGWMLLIAVLTAGLGGAGWYYFLREPVKEINQEATQQQAAATPPAVTSSQTKHYNSSNFSLEFDHPSNWIVTDNTAKLTVASQGVKAKTVSGTSQMTQVVVTIQPKQASTPAFKAGNATAVRESEKITYTKPSPAQRGSSFISFLGYADSAEKGLDAVYVTGDNGYTKGQAIPQVDVAKADPLITVTFNSCSDAKCSTPGKALTLSPATWDDETFSKPIKDLLQSLVVQ